MYGTYVKRPLDMIAAALGLILLSPVLLAVAVAVRLNMGSPIFFRQRRPGLHERRFDCLKFRTMTEARDVEGKLLSDSQRVTPLGLLLRKTSLDELPQLWSILRGDMSFIGPRPLFERYLPYYRPEERRRHLVRPGLTGWAQIHGRNHVPADNRLALDVFYVDNLSALLDLRILFATISMVVSQTGFEVDPAAVLPDFAALRPLRCEAHETSSESQ
jgi:lipopolysaccharide/colanic/teichoic acid biosynthesis glycosyltransferase